MGREAELRRAHDELEKCFKLADYLGAATAKGRVAALTSAEPCSHRNHGRSKADWPAVSAEGHESQTAMEIEELNPWCFLTLGMIVLALALAAHLQSLTFLTLGVILLSHIRWRA